MENRKKGLKRRARITRAVELQQYGYTEGCLGCDAAARSAKAVSHSEACRKRIEAKMLGDEVAAARLLRARKRRGGFHGAVPTAKQARSAATKSAKAVSHSEACRKRIEAKMLGDEVAAARLLRARKRRGEVHGAVPTTKQARSAATAAAKEAKMLLARAAAAAAAGEESARGDRRRRRHKGP